jgi:glucose/arabinose dehydrogenase
VPKANLSQRVTLIAAAPVLVLAVLISGCGGDSGGDVQQPTPVTVTTVTVTAPDSSIDVGKTVQLTATAKDAGGATIEGKTFAWATADAAVASVSATGLVTGLADGQVEIRATTDGVAGTIIIAVAAVALPPPGPVSLGLQEVASGLHFPLYLTSPPGDDRLFVVEKGGAIRVIQGGTVLDPPFLDLTSKVLSPGGEQGLLGLAFFPDYASSGRFIVHYVDLDGNTRVSLVHVSADPNRADPASESLVLANQKSSPAHNGGQILFGPDGMLYIGLGDGADADHGHGQSLADLFGSILRIDVSSSAPYAVPPDNPFVGIAGDRAEVWSYGFRNPWRFSFDRGTGDLYIGDVGESTWEEVNVASAADGAGRAVNYGWSRMEGPECFGRAGCDQAGLTLPIVAYNHDTGCAVSGGYVYRGAAIPGLQGTYLYADYCRGWVRSFRMQGGVATEQTDWPSLATGKQVTSFGEDAAGELYLVTQQGSVFKIVSQ